MRYTLRALSALITYPGDETQANIGAIRSALHEDGVLPEDALDRLEPLFRTVESTNIYDLQAAYSDLFDGSRSLSLHLFEHVHGDSRERGQAMIDLGQTYLARGFMMERSELPDYLPMFLEFLSVLPDEEARDWLTQPAHVLAALAERLEGRGSHYAGVFHCLLQLSKRVPTAEDIGELSDYQDPTTPEEIDRVWEEAPVNFNAPIEEATQPSRLLVRLRAVQRDAAIQAKGGGHA